MYKSKYGDSDKNISAAQYLAEVMCERQAKKNRQQLGAKFWNSVQWKKEYKKQLFLARQLLNTYSDSAIFAALNTKSGKYIYSLGFKDRLDNLIKIEQAKIDESNKHYEPVAVPKVETFLQTPKKKSKLSKLDE